MRCLYRVVFKPIATALCVLNPTMYKMEVNYGVASVLTVPRLMATLPTTLIPAPMIHRGTPIAAGPDSLRQARENYSLK